MNSLERGNLHDATNRFIDTLIENRRLESLIKIANRYTDYYKILNKEESIRIISASELSSE